MLRPAVDQRRPHHRHRWMLLLICVVALLRGLYWVGALAMWNHIDEIQHFAYVESLATGGGVPVVGQDLVSDEVIALAKDSPTGYWRAEPIAPRVDDPQWGATAAQYEGVQAPLYYGLMVGPYWLGRGLGGLEGAAYAVRIGTLLVALVAIPLTWMLARELFPKQPAVWLLSAGVLAIVNGLNSNLAAATNDAIVVPLGALAALLFVRAARSFTTRDVALAGVALGVLLLAKQTAFSIVPCLALAGAWAAWERRVSVRTVGHRAALFGMATILQMVPWVAYNLWTYHAPTASKQADELLGDLQPAYHRNLSGAREVIRNLRTAFWDLQPYNGGSDYQRVWELALLAIGGLAIVVALLRRDRQTARLLGWLFAALPLAMLAWLSVLFVIYQGRGSTPGRYLYAVFPLVAILLAAGLVASFGGRWGTVVGVGLMALVVQAEISFDHRYVNLAYGSEVFGPSIPVIDQSWADRSVRASAVAIDAPCTADFVGIGITRPENSSTSLTVQGGGSESQTIWMYDLFGFSYYRLVQPLAGRLEVVLPGAWELSVSDETREPRVTAVGASGNPAFRVFCTVAEPAERRFRQLYEPNHPPLTRGFLLGWPRWWSVGGWVAFALMAVAAMAAGRGLRRSPYRVGDGSPRS